MKSITVTQTARLWLLDVALRIGRVLFGPAAKVVMELLPRRRVPLLLQMTVVECGAACLAMVLSYYGRRTSASECREWFDIGRDGVTARAIAEAARHYGLRVKAFSLEPGDFKHVLLPAIAHWEFKHFVVVERWSAKKVEIVDPALGRRQLTAAEFDAGFTGVVLTLEPDIHFKGRRTTARISWTSYLRYMFLHTRGTPGLLIQILGVSLLLQVLGLALPLFTKVFVDQVIPLRLTNLMTILGIGISILAAAQLISSYLRAALLVYLRARLDSQLMLGFFEHVLALPFRFFQQRTSGDLLMRLGSNTIIRETLTSQTLATLLDGSLVFVYLAILLTWEPFFGGIVLGIGILQVAILFSTNRRMHSLMQRDLVAQAESQSYLVEALVGIATLKASGAEGRAFNRWSNLFFKHLNVSMQRGQLSAMVETALTTLRAFSPLILLWIGTLSVLNGTMSLGTMLALNSLAIAILTPLASLVSIGQQWQLVGAHLDRIGDVLEAEPEQDLQKTQKAPRLTGRIELQQVSFRYDPNAPLVLQDISVTVEPGQKVALVGPTGSGKSTLAKLLLGLYTPTEGQILYDGIPLHRMDYSTLRSQFGVVLQESTIFSSSIRQNIAFHDPNLSLAEVVEAAQLAAIHEEIIQMPMGYETIVAEGGAALSGGQRQRLAIARALAHKPAILLLDETTSHLDVVTENLVDWNLSLLSCTRIVIAHRLSTVRNADLILVLDKGSIVERGSHEELIDRGGAYARLVHSQLERETALANEV